MALFAVRSRSIGHNRQQDAASWIDAADCGRARRRRRPLFRRRGGALGAAALFAAATAALTAPAARAGTEGNPGGLAGIFEVAQVMGVPITFTPPQNPEGLFGYIRNDYIGVVVGFSGTTSKTNQLGTTAVTHNHAGMISFGNQKGGLIYDTDDTHALNGFNIAERFDPNSGKPGAWGVWPLPAWWQAGGGVITYDYSSYLRANVDNVVTNIVGGDPANTIAGPAYVNGALRTQYQLTGATGGGGGGGGGTGGTGTVQIDQIISLYRATAQLRWTIRNPDTVAHQVTLRFTVPIGEPGLRNFVFQDPLRGNVPSDQITVIPGANLPDTMTFYGKRYEPDDPSAPPFAARFRFRTGSNAPGSTSVGETLPINPTLPNRMYVGPSIELRPNQGGFVETFSRTTTGEGVALALYYGPYTVQPGGTQEVIAYYGNGQASENLQDDVAVGAESTESVGYNAAAASDASIVGNVNLVNNADQLAAARRLFLTPNPITIYGDVFNRKLQSPLFNVDLTDVNMSLVLPTGLSFATNPDTNQIDVSARPIGTVTGDTDVVARWYAQANGDVSGVLTYQVAASARQIGARTVTRAITIPATPLHPVTNAGYQIIGLPFEFDPIASNNGDPTTILNALAPPALRETTSLLFEAVPTPDDPINQVLYIPTTQIRRGYGYFYRPAVSRVIFAAGARPSSRQADPTEPTIANPNQPGPQQIQVPLRRGWNLISNPYVYPIPASYLRLRTTPGGIGGPVEGGSNLLDAVNNGLVRGTLFSYDPVRKTYDIPSDLRTATLDPWVGYWLYVNSDLELIYTRPTQHNSVVLPPTGGVDIPYTRAQKGGLFTSGRALVQNPRADEWKLQLLALRGDGNGDRATVVGVSRTVKPGDAAILKPPIPVDDYVYVGLVKGDNGGNGRYAQIIQSATAGGTLRTWDLDVRSDTDGPATLLWPNASALSRKVSLKLKDMVTGKIVDLRSRSSLRVDLRKNEPHRFQLIASGLKSVPLNISNLRTVGGGRAQQSAGSSFEFAFALSQDAEVTGRVTTFGGREVARLASGRSTPAGESRLKWNGRAASGATIAPGTYKVEITARGEDGETRRISVPFTSLR